MLAVWNQEQKQPRWWKCYVRAVEPVWLPAPTRLLNKEDLNFCR
jgi:hypothetical protein